MGGRDPSRPRSILAAGRRRVLGSARRVEDRIRAGAALRGTPSARELQPAGGWEVKRVLLPRWARTGVTAVVVGGHGTAPTVVLKLSHSEPAAQGLRVQRRAQQAVRSEPGLTWASAVPSPLFDGVAVGRYYTAESYVAGQLGTALVADPQVRGAVLSTAAAAIHELHLATAEHVTAGPDELERWVERPLEVFEQALARHAASGALERMRSHLREELEGRSVAVSTIHGDYWPGNLMFDADSLALTGMIDWDRFAHREIPLHDVHQLLLTTRRHVRGHGIRDVLAAVEGTLRWEPDEAEILRRSRAELGDPELGDRAMILLNWIRHVANTLRLMPHYAGDDRWLGDEVLPVLGRLDGR